MLELRILCTRCVTFCDALSQGKKKMSGANGIVKESLTIFRAVRRYTETFTAGGKNVSDLYEAMGDTIQNKLSIDVAIYRSGEGDLVYKQVYASPKHKYLPRKLHVQEGSLADTASRTFEGSGGHHTSYGLWYSLFLGCGVDLRRDIIYRFAT